MKDVTRHVFAIVISSFAILFFGLFCILPNWTIALLETATVFVVLMALQSRGHQCLQGNG